MDPKLLQVEAVVKELLEKLGVSGEVEVSFENETFTINIETEDSGVLIGYHGETLRALNLILTFLVSSKLGNFTRVTLDVSGYRRAREEKLLAMAEKVKERVREEMHEVAIPNLSASERRIIHLLFQNDGEVTTESRGIGEGRELVIKPK